MQNLIPIERIAQKIYLIRGKKVMLDSDLAEFYGVKTRVLNQAVKRNLKRFPENFMFQLTRKEHDFLKVHIVTLNLKSQFVTSRWGGKRKLPFAFTEHGVVMLASVLKSNRAVQVSIAVVNAFIRMREYLATHRQILEKIKEHDENFIVIFNFLKELKEKPEKQFKIKKYGFRP